MSFRKYEEYSEEGELIFSSVTQRPKTIQGRWFAMHNGKIDKYIFEQTSLVKVKILMLLGAKMILDNPYIKITKAKIAAIIGHSVKQVWQAMKSLENDNLIMETNIDGQTAFIINPAYISKGSKARQIHMEEWENLQRGQKPAPESEESQTEQMEDGKIINKETGEIMERREETA